MPPRPLSDAELRVSSLLVAHELVAAYLYLTATGHQKGIMDATAPVRRLLKEAKLHDYEAQARGPSSKVLLDARYVGQADRAVRVSLYRPKTKDGDPRIWVYGLSRLASPNDVLALVAPASELVVLNLTQLALRPVEYSRAIFDSLSSHSTNKAQELLQNLRRIAARGPLPAIGRGDTAVGRTIEFALGIPQNSSKFPDFHGIEIKSFRSSRTNRRTLFAQVPDWDISPFKSSAAILDGFGYHRDGELKLYNTLSCCVNNAQGLRLRLDQKDDRLAETHEARGDIAYWRMETLRRRLLQKHHETFWVEVETTYVEDKEHFVLKKVEHTKSPIESQLEPLLATGVITVDHLIKRFNGRVREKGPLFKTTRAGIEALFPPSEYYDL